MEMIAITTALLADLFLKQRKLALVLKKEKS